MNNTSLILLYAILVTACQVNEQAGASLKEPIGAEMFRHHYITQDMPGETDWGYGCPALADFDNDGDLDYAWSGQEGLFWFGSMFYVEGVERDVNVRDVNGTVHITSIHVTNASHALARHNIGLKR